MTNTYDNERSMIKQIIRDAFLKPIELKNIKYNHYDIRINWKWTFYQKI